MNPRPVDPRALNVRAFCGEAAALSGEWPLAALSRLTEGLFSAPEAGASVGWSIEGSLRPVAGGEPEVWLHLKAQAKVALQCQRCLQQMQQALSVDRRFLFVRSEEEAERLDESSEDDVMVLSPRLDLQELLEDELILALPLVPKHEGTCPQPLPLPANPPEEGSEAPHPFAALAALRGGRNTLN
jgi:uncharacterized protein